jgi:hypothetical protein
MQENVSALDAHNMVQEAANKHATPKVRVVEKIEIDQAVRQGDIYLTRIASIPKDVRTIQDRQLAPGTTQGSRHVVAGDGVTISARLNESNPLQGPYLKADKAFTVEHPEHGHICLPAGDYSATYQRDFSAEELARVRD